MASESNERRRTALILIAEKGTEEIEFVTVYDVLTRAGIEPTSMAVSPPGVDRVEGGVVECTRNVRIVPDSSFPVTAGTPLLSEHDLLELVDGFDVLVLPGGAPGAALFGAHPGVRQLVAAFFEHKEKWVAAICAATAALVPALEGKLEGQVKTVAGHPSVADKVQGQPGWSWHGDEDVPVVVEGRLITSRGPGTALLFSLRIVEELLGAEASASVAKPMVLPKGSSW